MSFFFLTGEYAYKIKKPVNFGFLDFSTLEKRRFYCYEEVRLNKRLAPEIYLGVVEITQDKERFFVNGEGKVVEYAVKMHQFPSDLTLDKLLPQGKVIPEMLEKVAEVLNNFHKTSETNEEISSYGKLEIVKTNTDENFDQTEEYIDITISRRQFEHIKAYTNIFLAKNASLFEKRAEEGRIRDCHGDLHSAHICFGDRISIFDCIEFNKRFRYCDVANEIAFLAMDLDYHGYPELSDHFVNTYVRLSKDRELLQLLNFYKCYRAYVRGKVEGFKLNDPHISEAEKRKTLEVAKRYFELAHSYTPLQNPAIFITTGLIGSGKTTLSRGVGSELGISIISSDIVRKKLAQIEPTERRFENFDKGIYSPEFSEKTYNHMFEEAREILKEGHSVILDASFRKKLERQRARELAEKMEANFFVLECICSEKEIKNRLSHRFEKESVSDGRMEIFDEIKEDFKEINEVPSQNHIIINTSGSVEEAVSQVLRRLTNILI